MSKSNLKQYQDDPERLTLEEALAATPDEDKAEIAAAGRQQAQELSQMVLTTLRKALTHNNARVALYLDRRLHHRAPNDCVKLPKRWPTSTRDEKVKIIDKMLAKGEMSPAQAREILDLGDSVQLTREIEALKAQVASLQRGDQSAAPAKGDKPKKPGVKRDLPKAEEQLDLPVDVPKGLADLL